MILPPEAIIIGFDEDTWEPLWKWPEKKGEKDDTERLDDQTGMGTLRDIKESQR